MRGRSATAPVSSGGFALARIVRLIGSVVAGLIVLGIAFVVFEANPGNSIVEWVTDAARWLVGPFKNLFTIESQDWRVIVNWGLAAIAYLVVSRAIARLLAR